MNKKAYLTSFVFGFIGLFILILTLVALMPVNYNGQEVSESIESLNNIQKNMSEQFAPNESNNVFLKVTYSFIGFVIYSAVEVSKFAIEWGAANPDTVNPKILLWIIMVSLLAPISIALLKIAIILFLLVKEHSQSRKEKRELKRFKK